MTKLVLSFATLTLALAAGAPAFANHAPEHTAAQTKARCDKLKPAVAAKDAKCIAYKKAHPDAMQAGDAMMSSDDAMQSKDH